MTCKMITEDKQYKVPGRLICLLMLAMNASDNALEVFGQIKEFAYLNFDKFEEI
ncbi:MAG: hypothetical protein J6Q32_01085 [Clostridia bacterium]|nr:hypothetical protein [Clostridia bacterium]